MSANRRAAIKSNELKMKGFDCAKEMNDKTSIPIRTDSEIGMTHNAILTQFPAKNSIQGLINVPQNNNVYNDSIKVTDQKTAQIEDRISRNLINISIERSQSLIKKPNLQKRQTRNRHSFDSYQTAILEKLFEQNTHYPDWTAIDRLSKQIRMPVNKIQIWFQNRRAKFRRSCSAALLKNRLNNI